MEENAIVFLLEYLFKKLLKINLQKVTHGSILRFKFSIVSLVTMINHIDWILSQSICTDFLYSVSVARTVPRSGVGG
eukprot:SAG31_NODE_903_length_11121_cov_10.117311_5_plen_77_part_00